MLHLISNLICGLLGLGTGIFIVLSLVERPVWRLMRDARAKQVSDADARAVHAILKRVIHLLPPAMMATMGTVTLLILAQLFGTGLAWQAQVVAGLFGLQLVLIVARLRRDIRGVEEVPSDGDIEQVRDGLGALALAHHRGLLLAASTLIAQWVLIVGL